MIALPAASNFSFGYKFEPTAASCANDTGRREMITRTRTRGASEVVAHWRMGSRTNKCQHLCQMGGG